jgi:hypothetical protein
MLRQSHPGEASTLTEICSIGRRISQLLPKEPATDDVGSARARFASAHLADPRHDPKNSSAPENTIT